jgi:hypothetical protein
MAPFGRADKPPFALLCSFELALASPAVARLATGGFLARCIRQYQLDGVLAEYRDNDPDSMRLGLYMPNPASAVNMAG